MSSASPAHCPRARRRRRRSRIDARRPRLQAGGRTGDAGAALPAVRHPRALAATGNRKLPARALPAQRRCPAPLLRERALRTGHRGRKSCSRSPGRRPTSTSRAAGKTGPTSTRRTRAAWRARPRSTATADRSASSTTGAPRTKGAGTGHFWAFYRYNDYTGPLAKCNPVLCSDHEGDWEGVTVITTPSLTPTILGVIYAAHRNRILVEAEDLPSMEGHPLAYVAEGTHATYPYRLQRRLPPVRRPGGRRAGAGGPPRRGRPLGRQLRTGVRHLPVRAPVPRDRRTWRHCRRRWRAAGRAGPGRGGRPASGGECGAMFTELQGSPASPGTQARFRCPWAPTDESPRLSEHGGLSESEPAAGAARSYATCARRAGSGL